MKFVHSPNFPDIIRNRFGENDLISNVAEMSFRAKINDAYLQEEGIFENMNHSSVNLDELLWVWKYLFQELAKGNETPIARTGLGNVWNLRDSGISCKIFFCMYEKAIDVYLHTKQGNIWIPNHKFFLKKS